jgi:redox-sensitive bicupin YhaK (pirin superfamily)
MIKIISHDNMGKGQQSWLRSVFHFSFATYYNPHNIKYGVLRVLNDDIIAPHSGFDTHPHADMEIVSYIISGVISHKDSMGNQRTLSRGQVQYLSAGTGIQHSEYNHTDQPLRILQLWILPEASGLQPTYGQREFDWQPRVNKLMPLVGGTNSSYPIVINQDVHIDATYLQKGEQLSYEVRAGRQCYIVLIEGCCTLNDIVMLQRDGAKVYDERLVITATDTDAHLLLVEMRRG